MYRGRDLNNLRCIGGDVMADKLSNALTLAAVGVCGYLVLTNWNSLKKIGSGASGKISDGIDKVADAIGDAAPKE